MAIIYTYPTKSNPVDGDLVLISDTEDGNKTKQVSIANIRGATTSGVSSIIAGDNISLPSGGTGDVTVATTSTLVADLNGAVLQKVLAKETLAKGDVVYISGGIGDNPEVRKARANSSSTMAALGIMKANTDTDAIGECITSGELTGVDLTGFNTGDELFVSDSAAGELMSDPPPGEANLIQKIGKVIKGGNGGALTVLGAFRTNATPNLNEGNIFIGDSNNQTKPLTIGANNTVLTSNGTTATWATTIGGSGNTFKIPVFNSPNTLTDSIVTNVSSGTLRIDVGGLVRSSGGTLAEPAYSFVSDLNTGIVNLGPDTLTLIGGGQSSFIVSNTTITSQKVHVFDATAGFKFGPTGDVMNNYEEGTWTPTAAQAGGIGSPPTTASSAGTYTRIGNIVHVTFNLVVTGSSTVNASAWISGLPFTADSSVGSRSAGSLFTNTDANTPQNYPSTIKVSGSNLELLVEGSAKASNAAPLGLEIDANATWYRPTGGTGITLEGSATYKVA